MCPFAAVFSFMSIVIRLNDPLKKLVAIDSLDFLLSEMLPCATVKKDFGWFMCTRVFMLRF